mgnify:CR=1 FL=1
MFKKVCIIGCGLIGSSLARVIKKKKLAEQIVDKEYCMVMNGDSYTEFNAKSLFESGKQKNSSIMLIYIEKIF